MREKISESLVFRCYVPQSILVFDRNEPVDLPLSKNNSDEQLPKQITESGISCSNSLYPTVSQLNVPNPKDNTDVMSATRKQSFCLTEVRAIFL